VFGNETRNAGDDADAIRAGKEKGIKALAVHDVLAGSVDPGAGKAVCDEATVLGCLRLNPRIISSANPVRQPQRLSRSLANRHISGFFTNYAIGCDELSTSFITR
jgi:hypothetical protein